MRSRVFGLEFGVDGFGFGVDGFAFQLMVLGFGFRVDGSGSGGVLRSRAAVKCLFSSSFSGYARLPIWRTLALLQC